MKKRKNKTSKFMLLVLLIITFIPVGVFAKGDFSLTVRSKYQVENGGNPEYSITNKETKEETKIIVSNTKGTTINLKEGTYLIKETKTTDGFEANNKGEIEISLPHIDEKGRSHNVCIVEMKSHKTDDKLYEVGKTGKKKETEEEDKEKEYNDFENILNERPEPETEDTEEEIEDKPYEEEEIIDYTDEKEEPKPVKKNPKTGDDAFAIEVAAILSVIFLIVLYVWLNKIGDPEYQKKKRAKRMAKLDEKTKEENK